MNRSVVADLNVAERDYLCLSLPFSPTMRLEILEDGRPSNALLETSGRLQDKYASIDISESTNQRYQELDPPNKVPVKWVEDSEISLFLKTGSCTRNTKVRLANKAHKEVWDSSESLSI